MRDAIPAYVKKVKELAQYCKGNEQATKKSLIEPLFNYLGYDVADPRECIPEHREDFGKNRSAKPVDYAFLKDGSPIFFVEAKQVDRRLAGYDEQLGDYFAKAPGAKLGILTNGIHWRFYTDLENEHIMDKKPFVEWQVLGEEPPPYDFLTLLQKAQYNAELMRTFAQRRYQQNLLVEELSRLLEPAPEFIRLAIANIETRYLTAGVVDGWKPVLKAAIAEWAKQQRLSSVLGEVVSDSISEEQPRKTRAVETTKEELEGFAAIQRLLGPDRPVEYEDTVSYFKIHLPGRPSRAVCRLRNFGERQPSISVPLPAEQVTSLAPTLEVSPQGKRWSRIALEDYSQVEAAGAALRAAWDARSAAYGSGTEGDEDSEG
jgi:predicted type IV restriction endonuclease